MDTTPHLQYLRDRGMLVLLPETWEEVAERQIRVSSEGVCPDCGEKYFKHPYIENCLDWEGRPFLHLACDGRVLKL